MGQQQLLLLVLSTVIVGIALALGITMYSENSSKTNADALLQDVLRMSADAQSWKLRPQMFGGSPDAEKNDNDNFSDVNYFGLGYTSGAVDADCYRNSNGEYVLFPMETGLGIMGISVTNGNVVAVVVTGSTNDDVQMYSADWNPIRTGVGAHGRIEEVDSHQRCKGRSQRPIQAGG